MLHKFYRNMKMIGAKSLNPNYLHIAKICMNYKKNILKNV